MQICFMNSMLQKFPHLLIFLITLALGLFFVSRNNVGTDLNLIPGDLGDSRFNVYVLEHGFKYFSGTQSEYWNAPFMVPEEEVISYSDNLLGVLPFYAIFRVLNYDPLTSFQLWFLSLVVLNFTACFFLIQWLFKSPYAAALGAFIFAFSLALQSQMTHAQTFGRFASPLAFLFLLMFTERWQLKYLFASFIAVALQLYCGIYLGLLLFIPFLTTFLLIILNNKKVLLSRFKDKYFSFKVLGCFLVPFLVILPLFIPYIKRSSNVPLAGYNGIVDTIPVFKSFLFSQHGTLFWEFLSETGTKIPAFWDHQIFPGIIALLSLLISFFIVKPLRIFKKGELSIEQNPLMLYLTFASLITFISFIRVDKFSLYWLIHYLPGFGSMRSMTRIINIELLFFAIAVGFVFNWLVYKFKIKQLVLFILFMPLLLLDNFCDRNHTYHIPKDATIERVDLLVNKMNQLKPGSLVSYEPDTIIGNPIEYQLDAMLASQQLNLKCVNAYSATSPPPFTDFWNKLDSVSRVKWFSYKKFTPQNLTVIN
jgi:hypothetical protein